MTERSSPRLLATANTIRRSLGDFARQMRGLRGDHGLSASKLSALGRLQRASSPMSATELARLEGLQPQSLTRMIAALEAAGLIERRRNEADGRQRDIEISEAGAALLLQDARRQNEWLAAAMETRMTAAERAVLAVAAEILDRIGGAQDLSAEAGANAGRAGRQRAA